MRSRTTILTMATLALAGCHAAPIQEADFRASHVEFERDGVMNSVGQLAIAELSVESVDTKSRYPGPGAVVFDPATLVPPLHVFGVGIRLTEFPKGLREHLPTTFYGDAERALAKARIELVDVDVVAEASAYRDYGTERFVRSSVLRHLDPRGTDTGRARRSRTYPASGLAVLTGGDGLLEAVDGKLRAQLSADGVLRIRLRIGSHEGHATLESGSTLTLTTATGALSASLPRTIMSDEHVGRSEGYLPFRGSLDRLDRAAYRAAVRRLVRRFLHDALEGVAEPLHVSAS